MLALPADVTSVGGRGETGGDEEEQATDKTEQIHPGGGTDGVIHWTGAGNSHTGWSRKVS